MLSNPCSLGIAESGLFPGVVYYFSMWYKRNERQFRISLFFSTASMAGAFGGILAWGIAHMRNVGGLHGWQWIFILVRGPALRFGTAQLMMMALKEGLLTILLAISAYWWISNYPKDVSWLSDQERACVLARLEADSDATNHEVFLWSDVLVALKDYKCWLYGFGYYTISLPLYTLSLFLVSLIKCSANVHQIIKTPSANYCERHGLYLCTIATPHNPAICRRHRLHSGVGRIVREVPAPGCLHHDHDQHSYHRIYHPPHQRASIEAPRHLLYRRLLCRGWYLPVSRTYSFVASYQRLWADKARCCWRAAGHCRQLWCHLGHTAL
jgi:hypothetical protein